MEDSSPERLLSTQIKKRHAQLRTWARREGIHAFRLYDRNIPDIPLQIDIYGKYLHIAVILKSRNKTEEEQQAWNLAMGQTVAATLGMGGENLFIKDRKKRGGHYEPDQNEPENFTLDIEEGGLLFEVNLSDYLDTGLFLDHRTTRSLVREIAGGRRVLNLFSYTGSFSVYAAHGGAMATTSIDMSNTYSNWAGRNMEKNGFLTGNLHKIVRANVVDWMKTAVKKQERFDLIVCDPPTFSNSNRMSQGFNVQRDHLWLIQDCLRLLSKDGLLIFSTNFRQFKLREKELRPIARIEEITNKTLPLDFAKRRPHRCWIIRKNPRRNDGGNTHRNTRKNTRRNTPQNTRRNTRRDSRRTVH